MKISLVLSILCSLFVFGCSFDKSNGDFSSSNNSSKDISRAFESQKENTTDISAINKDNEIISSKIDSLTEGVKSDLNTLVSFNFTPDPNQKQSLIKINSDLDSILQSNKALQNNLLVEKQKIQNIEKEYKNIQSGVKYVKSLEDKIRNLTRANEQLRANAIKSLYTYLAAFFGIGFLTIIAGAVVAIFVNPKLGMMIAVIGILGNAAAAAMIYYLQTIALVSIIIIIATIVITIGLGIYYLIFVNKDNQVNSTVAKENIKLIEVMKDMLTPEQRAKVFGPDDKPLADKIQTETTKKVVSRIRQKMKSEKV